MRWSWDAVEWGKYAPERYQFYFVWAPNWLAPDLRHIGIRRFWYDGPHVALGFWWFNIGWSTQWTVPPEEYRKK